MALDTSIAMSVRPPADPMEQYGKAMTLRQLMAQQRMQDLQFQQAQRDQEQQQGLSDALRSGMGADGRVDYSGTLATLARSGNVKGYQALLKQQQDAEKAGADLAHTQAQTGKLNVETEVHKAAYVRDLVSSLASNPNLSHDDVIAELANVPPQYRDNAARLARSLPGDPAQLRPYLLTIGLLAQDRLKALTPMLQHVNDGKTTRFVDTNPLTNPGGPAPMAMQTTPGEDLGAMTTRRGQDLTDARARDLNAITRDGQQTQLVNDPNQGILLVNKGTKVVVPAVSATGQPIPSEAAAAQTKMAGQLRESIKMARDLIPQATGSGAGALVDKGANFVGVSTPGARAASQLETLAGWMASNVPRMQGPQSDNDVLLYRQMAGQVGDATLPAARRLAALDTLEQLQAKYSALNAQAQRVPTVQPMAPPQGVASPAASAAQNWQGAGYRSQAEAVQDALTAIQRGADRNAVRQRLQQLGIQAPGI